MKQPARQRSCTSGVDQPAADVLESASPEITVFDAAYIRIQRYTSRTGDGMIVVRVDGPDGTAHLSLSLFGVAEPGKPRTVPQINISSHDERDHGARRAETFPLPSLGDGRVRYLIVGESEAAIHLSAKDFQNGWGLAYNPLIGKPRQRRDGRWIAEATRWVSSD